MLIARADRAGRRTALPVTVALVSAGMALLTLTPFYGSIGIEASLLVVVPG